MALITSVMISLKITFKLISVSSLNVAYKHKYFFSFLSQPLFQTQEK